MQSRQTLQLLTGLSGDSNQSAFFNVRRMPSRNLSYDHKHLDCSVNHRGCWRICNREKKKTVGTHSFQPFHIHRSVSFFPPTVSSRPFTSCPSLITTSNKGKGSRGFHSKIYKETPVTKMRSRHFLHTPTEHSRALSIRPDHLPIVQEQPFWVRGTWQK